MTTCKKCGQPHYADPLYAVKLMWNKTTEKHEVWVNCTPYFTGLETEEKAEAMAEDLRRSITLLRQLAGM